MTASQTQLDAFKSALTTTVGEVKGKLKMNEITYIQAKNEMWASQNGLELDAEIHDVLTTATQSCLAAIDKLVSKVGRMVDVFNEGNHETIMKINQSNYEALASDYTPAMDGGLHEFENGHKGVAEGADLTTLASKFLGFINTYKDILDEVAANIYSKDMFSPSEKDALYNGFSSSMNAISADLSNNLQTSFEERVKIEQANNESVSAAAKTIANS